MPVVSSTRRKKRVLFVCTQNRVRSLTAQQLYRGRPDLEVQSAGISEYARVPMTQDLFEWADQVFVFSRRQKKALEQRYRESFGQKKVVCLHVADRFEYDRPKLVIKLIDKLGRYLGKPNGAATPAHEPAPAGAEKSSPPPNGSKPGRLAGWSVASSLATLLTSLQFR